MDRRGGVARGRGHKEGGSLSNWLGCKLSQPASQATSRGQLWMVLSLLP